MSTDSHDSVASHADLRHETVKKVSKLAESSFPVEKKKVRMSSGSGGEQVKVKKKHKKHKHHHCHKHRRHRSGSSDQTRHKLFSSPVRPASPVVSSDHDHDDSTDDSDHHNSSDDEVNKLATKVSTFLFPQQFLCRV